MEYVIKSELIKIWVLSSNIVKSSFKISLNLQKAYFEIIILQEIFITNSIKNILLISFDTIFCLNQRRRGY